jgi:hypothetical protein
MHAGEKRKYKRHHIEMTRVEVDRKDASPLGLKTASLQDLSKRGVGVRLRELLHIEERVNLKIHIPKLKKPLVFQGEVKWTKRIGGNYRAGIRLLQGDSKSKETIRKLCQRLESGTAWRLLNPAILPRAVLYRGLLAAIIAGMVIGAGILGGSRADDIAQAQTVRRYAIEKLRCPHCQKVFYSTESAPLDIPEEMNPEEIVICPGCHKQVSYYDLEVVWQRE